MDREIKSTRGKKRLVAISGSVIGIVLMLLIINSLVRCSVRSSNVKTSDVLLAQVERGDIEGSFHASGTVTPVSVYRVESNVSGKVEGIYHHIGDRVQEGDPLVKLSNDDLQLRLIDLEATVTDQISSLNDARILYNQYSLSNRRQIAQARIDLARARRAFASQQKLHDENYISEEDFLRAQEDFNYAQLEFDCLVEQARVDSLSRQQQIHQQENAIERIQLSFEQVRERISNLTIRAPMSGIISEMDIDTGQIINTGESIAVIENDDKYYIRAAVDQYYLSRLSTSCKVRYRDGAGEHWLTLQKIHPKLSGDKAIIDVGGDIPDHFISGQSVPLEIVSSTTPGVLKLPIGPYLNETGSQWVFARAAGESRAQKREVTFGVRNIREVEVVSGLQEGEEVIVSSYKNWLKKDWINLQD